MEFAVARKTQEEEWFFWIGAELQRLSDEVLQGAFSPPSSSRSFWRPAADICETETDILVTVELAGVEKGGLSIVHSGTRKNTLIVRGRREPQPADGPDQVRCHQLEIFYGDFERELVLPDVAIDRENIKVRFESGILEISIPKRRVAKERRTIPVTESNG